VIWQGDANAQALRALLHCTDPTCPLNVSGAEVTSIRYLAQSFAEIFGQPAFFKSQEAPTAWLVDTAEAVRLFGKPLISLDAMIGWVAAWIKDELPTLGKETHYDQRDGKY
ncbi:MAG: epimerase, partial [Rhodospirillales bacterium]|nr:epimerase [Rhodospirillales bacterium]